MTKSISFLWLLTSLLLIIILLASLNFSFQTIFILMVIGQGIFVYTVFIVLKEDYHTDKTFDDFYEDNPIDNS